MEYDVERPASYVLRAATIIGMNRFFDHVDDVIQAGVRSGEALDYEQALLRAAKRCHAILDAQVTS